MVCQGITQLNNHAELDICGCTQVITRPPRMLLTSPPKGHMQTYDGAIWNYTVKWSPQQESGSRLERVASQAAPSTIMVHGVT